MPLLNTWKGPLLGPLAKKDDSNPKNLVAKTGYKKKKFWLEVVEKINIAPTQ
jgi:hypothetical protein